MTAFRKDLAATVATGLAVLTYIAAHEGWDVWLIGDYNRWAAGFIAVFGLAVFVLEWEDSWACLRLLMLAVLFAALAFISGELTALSLLVVTIVVLWFETTVRDIWRGAHHHPTTA